MSDDLSDLIKNFSNSNIDMNKVNDILNSLNTSDKSSSTNNSTQDTSSNSNTTNNIDINTILKIKEIMDKINSTHNDKRSHLLMALKPFLRESRQTKLDQYMKLLDIAPLLEMFKNDNGGDKNV